MSEFLPLSVQASIRILKTSHIKSISSNIVQTSAPSQYLQRKTKIIASVKAAKHYMYMTLIITHSCSNSLKYIIKQTLSEWFIAFLFLLHLQKMDNSPIKNGLCDPIPTCRCLIKVIKLTGFKFNVIFTYFLNVLL